MHTDAHIGKYQRWQQYKRFLLVAISFIFVVLVSYFLGILHENVFTVLIVIGLIFSVVGDFYFRLFVLKCPYCGGYLWLPFWNGRSFYLGNFALTGACPSCHRQIKKAWIKEENLPKLVVAILIIGLILFLLAIIKGIKIEHHTY